MINTSQYDITLTANTCGVCAKQRAFNVANLYHPKSVLELCVGPSLPILRHHYSDYNISVIGNDVDNSHIAKSILAPIFVLGLIVGFSKLANLLNYLIN